MRTNQIYLRKLERENLDVTDDSLTLNDFNFVPWDEITESAKEKTCFGFVEHFYFLAASHLEGSRERRALQLLVVICRFRLNASAEDGQVFGPHYDSVSDEDIKLLGQLVPEVSDPELKARMADMAWVRKNRGNFPLALEAIRSYLNSATRNETRHWPDAYSRIERALQLVVRQA